MTLTPDEIPDRPTVDRWSPSDFATHCAAKGVELHASPRFGGPPILGAALVVGVGTVVLEAIEECDGVEIDG